MSYPSHNGLFPETQPRDWGLLPLDSGHEMYWEETGNPRGVPVVFLHGGPGAGAGPVHRRFFDPEHYRIILFDQRGCGRSTPHGGLEANTTPHLIADMERLRRHLDIERWLLFGGSWGSTLALAYGVEHPERCLGFVLRGVFLAQAEEIDWFLYGMRRLFPEAWRAFTGFLPSGERDDLLKSYYRRLVDPDPAVHMPAARAWRDYESACSTLMPNRGGGSDAGAVSLARLEAHYFRHDMFIEPDLPPRLSVLHHLPAIVVQGRYDIICPPVTAEAMVRAWPEARLMMVPDAGHSALEPNILSALVGATEAFKKLI